MTHPHKMIHSHGEVPCDFLSYLEWRLGSDRDTTTEMLAEWLATYQPQRRHENGPGQREPGPPPRNNFEKL